MYSFTITTPANTTKANATRTPLALRAGTITQVEIAFPPGPSGLVHCRIEQGGSILWPFNGDDGYAWDDYTVVFNPLHNFDLRPFELDAVTWNTDDSFAHRVDVRINIVRTVDLYPNRPEVGMLQDLTSRLFGGRRRS